jgi:hypothetical protein
LWPTRALAPAPRLFEIVEILRLASRPTPMAFLRLDDLPTTSASDGKHGVTQV